MRRTGGAIVKTFPLKGASSLEKGIEYILVIVVKDTDGLLTRNHICLPGYFTSCKDIITCNNLRGQITIIQQINSTLGGRFERAGQNEEANEFQVGFNSTSRSGMNLLSLDPQEKVYLIVSTKGHSLGSQSQNTLSRNHMSFIHLIIIAGNSSK